LGWCNVQAQTNFTETYKKARAFTTSQPDSAMLWAYKSWLLTQNNTEKYKASYLIAYSANRLCLSSVALHWYNQASIITHDSTQKYDALNSKAAIYLRIGNYGQADSLNKQSIAYFKKQNDTYSLSYSYELQGAILQQRGNYGALDLFRQALQLRKQQTSQNEIGTIYRSIAKAFASFNIPDSAVYYQKKAIESYPMKSPNQVAIQQIFLAKYLLLADQTSAALPHLQTAERLRKRPLTELLRCHTFGLYLSRLDVPAHAKRIFARCDSLLTRALAAAPDAPTRKAISAQAVDMYADALQIKTLPDSTRLSYQAQLKLAQKHLKVANANLKLKERYYSQALGKGALPLGGTSGQSIWQWAPVLIGIAGLVFGGYMWQRSKQQTQVAVEPLPDPLAQENAFLEEVVAALGNEANKLKLIDHETIKQLCKGKSYNKIGEELNAKGDTIKTRLNRLAKNAGYASMLDLIKKLKAPKN
jgi:hypothetical protein